MKLSFNSMTRRMTMALLLGGSILASAPQMAQAQELTDMTIATGVDPSFAPFYVAKASGIFEKNGLNVTVNTGPSGSAMIAFLIGDQINAAYGAEQAGVSAHAVDDKVVAVADGTELVDWLSIVGSSEITNMEALKGKKIGVASGTGSETFWKAVLAKKGLNVADYEVINVEAPEMVAALERGDVDAFAAWEPWPTRATMSIKGASILQTNRDVLNLHNLVYMNKGWVEANPAASEAFVKSMVEAKTLIEADPAAAVTLVATFLRQPEELVAELMPKVRYLMSMDETTLEAYRVAVEQLEAAGKLPKAVTAEEMLLPDLLKAVAPEAVKLP